MQLISPQMHPVVNNSINLNIQASAQVCISVQLIVIKLCYRVISYSVYYANSTR